MVAPALSGAFLIPFLGMYGGPSLLWEILTPYLEGVRWPQPSLRPFLPHVCRVFSGFNLLWGVSYPVSGEVC